MFPRPFSRRYDSNPSPPSLTAAPCLLSSATLDLSGKLQVQRARLSLGACVAHKHELGMYRDRERCGLHRERLSGFVVVHAQRGPLAREGCFQSCHPRLFRVKERRTTAPTPPYLYYCKLVSTLIPRILFPKTWVPVERGQGFAYCRKQASVLLLLLTEKEQA